MKYIALLNNPLAQGGRIGNYLRLVLAEAAKFGMPGDVIAALDDIAALLGFYDPLPANQAAHIAGPIVQWRTHPDQPTFDRSPDVEALAYAQRALIAFSGGKPHHMVGTAEIVIAMGNIIEGESPPEYYEVFTWASVDVLKTLTDQTEEEIFVQENRKDWKKITDAEVVEPGGRLYPTYQEVATSIRRFTIAAMDKRITNNPREFLRPVAAHYIEGHTKVLAEAAFEKGPLGKQLMSALEQHIAAIRRMYPDLGTTEEEVARHNRNIEREMEMDSH